MLPTNSLKWMQILPNKIAVQIETNGWIVSVWGETKKEAEETGLKKEREDGEDK